MNATLKTPAMTLENFTIAEVFESDQYSTTYVAYDKAKKTWCYLEIPNVKTSWLFNVIY